MANLKNPFDVLKIMEIAVSAAQDNSIENALRITKEVQEIEGDSIIRDNILVGVALLLQGRELPV